MANNIADSVSVVVPATTTKVVYTLPVYGFKSIKFLISVVDNTNHLATAFEALVSYKKQPSMTALLLNSAVIGDSMNYNFTVAFVPDETTGNIELSLLNSSASEMTIYLGEIERVE